MNNELKEKEERWKIVPEWLWERKVGNDLWSDFNPRPDSIKWSDWVSSNVDKIYRKHGRVSPNEPTLRFNVGDGVK